MSSEYMNIPFDYNTGVKIVNEDLDGLTLAEQSYGNSWKKRGGVDSFMMLARKWDRIEHQVEKHGFNILTACMKDQRPEGILDDIRDLRRYLILVEQEVLQRNKAEHSNSKFPITEKDGIYDPPDQAGDPNRGYVDQG